MNKYNDSKWIGNKYNMLTVIEPVLVTMKNGDTKWYWRCLCDCGKEKIMNPYIILYKTTKSCGCYNDKMFTRSITKHGEARTRLYKIWCGMNKRCDPSRVDTERYGKRGIRVCEEWHDYTKFAEWARSHGYEDGLSIERIDVNGNYCPENCTWIPLPKQARNRRTTRWVEYQGKTMSLAEAAERANQRYGLVALRLSKGWSLEKALNTPVQDNKSELHKECDSVGADYNLVCARIKSGWSKEDAISIPKQKHGTGVVNPNASFATCAVCGKEFKKRTACMKYCSSDCARIASNIAQNRKRAISKQQAATK